MLFRFRVNPLYVFLHALNASQKEEPFSGWYNFANRIWQRSPGLFYFLSGQAEFSLYLEEGKTNLVSRKADRFLRSASSTPEFRRLVTETDQYRLFVENQVGRNKTRVHEILGDLLGFGLPNKTITVYVTHPKLKNGIAIDNKTIVWGHPERYSNYSTVFIFHEVMHIITRNDPRPEMHAAIELLTDNELRIRLNEGGKYFEHPGHAHLAQLEREMLPSWKRYLKLRRKNFFRFVKIHARGDRRSRRVRR